MPVSTQQYLPAPPTMGLPDKFNKWRRGQSEAILKAMDSSKRFVVLGMPTGFGKSLVYMTCGMLGEPTVILTSTKGLQNQLVTDFYDAGLRDIRGMNNYPCKEMNDGLELYGDSKRSYRCDEGPCLCGWECAYAKAGCTYFDAQRDARNSGIAVTNYAYWMGVNGSGDPNKPVLGKRGRLVLDEAHAALDELGEYLAIEVGHWEIEGVLGREFPREATMAEWRDWARTIRLICIAEIEQLGKDIKTGKANRRAVSRHRELRDLERRAGAICGMKGEWVHEESRDRRGRRVVRFDPVWPGEYAEKSLFCGVEKVILTSATIRPKTLELLGVSREDYEFIEYPSAFPVSRRPFIHVPTARIRFDTDAGSMRVWASKIDRIIGARSDRKGIIHTVSFARRDYFMRYTEHRGRIITHESGGLQEAVDRFRNSPAGTVFVSPSVSTGFDFPDADCRYQIISKVPFPDSRSKVLQARQERDKEFFAYIAAQQLVQMAGRGNRHEQDWCETIVVDDNWLWFKSRYQKFMPKWFLQACKRSESIPAPLQF